jgi:hypothetical protein
MILETVGGIDSLSRNNGSDMREDNDWMLRSCEMDGNERNLSFAFCNAWGRKGRFNDSGWNRAAKVAHLGILSHF